LLGVFYVLIYQRYIMPGFVFSEAGAQCLRGVQWDSNHCYGFYNDLVSLNSWRVYRISRAGSVWGVGIELGGSFYTVAQISYNSSRIYLAHSDTEEGYYEDLDPYITAKFLYFRPQYLKQGNWVDWSLSDVNGLSSLSIYPPEKNMRFVRATMALLQL
jgi:hypothetical protein